MSIHAILWDYDGTLVDSARKNMAVTDFVICRFEDCNSEIRFRKGLTILNINRMYKTATIITRIALLKDPAFAIAITIANKHQAVMSSIAAQVITVVPRGVLLIPRSYMIRAITGNAAILIAIPINKANARKFVLAKVYSPYNI